MRLKSYVTLLVVSLMGIACALAGTPTPDVNATVEAALVQTQAAQPTSTPTPQPTATTPPTFTPVPTDTPTPLPATPEESEDMVVSEDENGWSRYELADAGLAISLPPEWTPLDMNAETFDEMLSAAGENNPALDQFMSATAVRNMAAAGIKFMALDMSVDSLSSSVVTNLNLLKSDLPFEISLDTYVEVNIEQIQEIMDISSEVSHERVELGGREAEYVTYVAALNDVYGQPQSTVFHQYLMLEGRTQYVLTFTNLKDFDEANGPIFEEIAQGFEIIE